jgi:hypothetical protein
MPFQDLKGWLDAPEACFFRGESNKTDVFVR